MKRMREEKKKGEKIFLFQGCLVKYFFPEIRESVINSLSRIGFQVVAPPDQVCCGAPSLHLGNEKDVQNLAMHNLKAFEQENPDYILTVCPTGNSLLKKLYPEIEPKSSLWVDKIFDYTEFMVKKGLFPEAQKAVNREKVYYHYPCHYLNALKLKNEPKKMLEALAFDLKEEEEPHACCGFCGIFSVKNPEISSRMWEEKKKKIVKSGTELVATDCPGCLFQLKTGLKEEIPPFKILHTAELYDRVAKQTSRKRKRS
jgi:Fe-S oxidoreductase